MFRVPTDPTNPTFEHTFKVSFGRWLASKKADRVEWARRRNAGADLAAEAQNARADEWLDKKIAENEEKRAQGAGEE